MTHEIHALQEVDGRRLNNAREKELYNGGTPEGETLNEAMVEAETLSRVEEVPKNPGYYSNISKNPSKVKKKDHELLRSDPLAVNKQHVENVDRNFDKLEIKRLKLKNSRETAEEVKKRKDNEAKNKSDTDNGPS